MEAFVIVVCILYTLSTVSNFVIGSLTVRPKLLAMAAVQCGMAVWGWNIL